MKTRKHTVINLATGNEFEFVNKIGSIQNLINCYITEEYGAEEIYNIALRSEIVKQIIVGERTYAIDDYTILKEGGDVE